MLKNFSLSVLHAEPDGVYTLMSRSPLYSADMLRPEGSLCLIVIGVTFLTSIAVPRIEVLMLWWVSYPLKFSTTGFVTSWRNNMSSSWRFMNLDSVPTLVSAVIPLILSVAIFVTCIRGGWGI